MRTPPPLSTPAPLPRSRDFKLYLTTKMANPHYTPEVSTKVCLVSFAVKESGLEAQLLGIVVQMEEPRLEAQKGELVVKVAGGKRKLVGACRLAPRACSERAYPTAPHTRAELENMILKLLSEVKGSLLDDQDLVEVLQTSKLTSEEVSKALEVAEVTEAQIDTARAGYRPVSARASLLYFVLNDLQNVDPMYQFSLDAYVSLFRQSIAESKAAAARVKAAQLGFDEEELTPEQVLAQRIRAINDWHTYEVYKYACRGLFERHKLLLSFQMCIRRLAVEGQATAAATAASGAKGGAGGGGAPPGGGDKAASASSALVMHKGVFDFLLKGGVVMDRSEQRANPSDGWLEPLAWDNVTELDKLEPFAGISTAFEQAPRDWFAWYMSPAPERTAPPGEFGVRCDDLMHMALVRAIRPDRVLFAATKFVSAHLGQRYVEPPPFDLAAIYGTSTAVTPLVFVLSPGVDPTKEVVALAAGMGVGLEYCSLGQGQDLPATRSECWRRGEGRLSP